MAGKGSKRRPMQIDADAYSKNWERIFNDDKETTTETDEDLDEITESIREGQDGEGC